MDSKLPIRYAWLTVVAALTTLVLKSGAAWVTGSVGLFSDALESIVNLVTGVTLVVLLKIAKAPPDSNHPYGHDKAEYFANGVQGTLILVAAVGIVVSAVDRFLDPRVLEQGTIGLTLAALAGLVNLLVAGILYRQGKSLNSRALRGEADHLMSDVATSLAVFIGVGLVYYTGSAWLDPLAAVGVSGVIAFTGIKLVRASVKGLMDTALPEQSLEQLEKVLDGFCVRDGITYHALRTRVSGARIFISVHILVPGVWSVKKGHELLEEIEADIGAILPGVSVMTHLEPIEEPCSFEDMELA
ncbi:MAG: cation diffusion facilitator family transporter [Vulcanimicrobiota bacterium]